MEDGERSSLPLLLGTAMSVEKFPELIEDLQEAREKSEEAGTIRR